MELEEVRDHKAARQRGKLRQQKRDQAEGEGWCFENVEIEQWFFDFACVTHKKHQKHDGKTSIPQTIGLPRPTWLIDEVG